MAVEEKIPNPLEDARYEAAADWLQRLDDPALKDEDLQAWLEWFDGSDENRRAFEELQPLYRRLHDLPDDFRLEARRRLRPGRRRWRDRWTFRSEVWSRAAGLAAVLLAAVIGFVYWWSPATAIYGSPAHQHQTVQLADRSALVLAADSVVAVKYTGTARILNVERGEAYFEVKHNAQRPFIVNAGDVRVTAVGTAFNVQRDSDQVVVTVTEGAVDVARAPGAPAVRASSPIGVSLRVAAGERLVLPMTDQNPSVHAATTEAELQWSKGQVDFVNAPLSEVLRVINPHAPRRLVIEDPRVADLTYSGTVLQDHIDEWAASLSQVYAIRSIALNDGSISLVMQTDPAANN